MKQTEHRRVYGHHLPALRPTLWVPFLIASILSLPVAVVGLIIEFAH